MACFRWQERLRVALLDVKNTGLRIDSKAGQIGSGAV
jgi:hypothetical protein